VSIQEEYDPDKIEGLYKELELVDNECELPRSNESDTRPRSEDLELNKEIQTSKKIVLFRMRVRSIYEQTRVRI